jgi:hypothetical protein
MLTTAHLIKDCLGEIFAFVAGSVASSYSLTMQSICTWWRMWEARIDTIGAAPDFDRARISGEITGDARQPDH